MKTRKYIARSSGEENPKYQESSVVQPIIHTPTPIHKMKTKKMNLSNECDCPKLNAQSIKTFHTSTPWEVRTPSDGVITKKGMGSFNIAKAYDTDDSNRMSNAEYIVRAVNAHEELVKMIKLLTAEYVDDGEIMLINQIIALLDKAERK